jgi:hypothetical protein
MPGNLRDNGMAFQDGKTRLFWDQSTDNLDPQSVIRYDVCANGVLDHSLVGGGLTILYGNPGVPNTYLVIAVDTAGNQSVPATLGVKSYCRKQPNQSQLSLSRRIATSRCPIRRIHRTD